MRKMKVLTSSSILFPGLKRRIEVQNKARFKLRINQNA